MGTGTSNRLISRLNPASTRFAPERFWLTIILIISVSIRVGAAFYFGDQVVELPGTTDQLSYDMLAQRVLEGHGFTVAEAWWPATRAGEPTAHWSYLYTLYLVVVYGLFGHHPLIARLIQAILAGILMPWLGYRLGCRHFNGRVGLVSAALIALYAYFIYYAVMLMTESFYIITILWTLDLASRLGQSPAPEPSARNTAPRTERQLVKPIVGLGLALTATVLLRQLFLLFIPILFAWLLWRSYRYSARPIGHMVGIIVGTTAILILSVVPWTLRNYRVFDDFVLLNTNAGFAFYWGNHPIHGYNFISILPSNGPSYLDLIPPELLELNEASLDRALLKRGLAFVLADPGRYVILSISRTKDYFKFWPSTDSSLISTLLRFFSFGVLWPFMLYGFLANLRSSFSTATLILYLFVITYTAIHLLSWALIRYRLPVDAVLLIFASVALVALYTKLTQYFANIQTEPEQAHS